MCPVGDLVEVVAHDKPQLSHCDADKEESGGHLKSENLDIELDEPDPGSPVECLPGIKHADTAAATNNLRLNLAAKAPIKGNDSLIFFWQHRCLNTGQRDPGGKYDSEDNENSNEDADESCGEVTSEDLSSDFTVVGRVLGVVMETVGTTDESRDMESKLVSGSPDSGWEENFAGSLHAGATAPPALRAWVAHDNVGPCHMNAAQDGMCEDSEEGLSEWESSDGAEEVKEEGIGEVVYNGHLKTTEPRPWASLSL